jgi:hypothetical protein
MSDKELEGRFTAHVDYQELRADVKLFKEQCQPPAGKPFIVYELREADPPREEAWTRLGPHRKPPVRFPVEQLGCYFAESARVACVEAARDRGQAGNFLAVEAQHFLLDFALAPALEAGAAGS